MIRAINRDLLRKKLQESPGRVILMDVRDKADFEAEHIKGAISVPIGELLVRAEQNWDKDHEIIVYCGSFECPASSKAAKMLDDAGFENVLDYEGVSIGAGGDQNGLDIFISKQLVIISHHALDAAFLRNSLRHQVAQAMGQFCLQVLQQLVCKLLQHRHPAFKRKQTIHTLSPSTIPCHRRLRVRVVWHQIYPRLGTPLNCHRAVWASQTLKSVVKRTAP